jgi:nucleoside-diphosphate-sugar epimerase
MRYFVTGASGWIGSAVVPGLTGSGHHVVGLARSDAAAATLTAAGAEVVRGTIDDLDLLGSTAAASDGVIHLAFKHDIAFSGDFQGAADADRRAVDTFGEALAGTGRPFTIASGVFGLAPGRVATERDTPSHDGSPVGARQATAQAVLGLAARGVRSSVVRLSPTCHGEGDNGFMAALVSIARAKGVSGYVGDGTMRWPAVHRLDAAHLFCLAAGKAPAGSVLHGVAEEGVAIRDVAEVIGRHLGVPVVSVGPMAGLDAPASGTATRELMGWRPAGPGLLEDLDEGHYFHVPGTTA